MTLSQYIYLPITATRNAKPSPEWSLAAQCRTTRGKIRSYFRTKEPQVAEAEGQRLVWNLLETNRALLEVELGVMPTVADLKKGVREYTGHASLAELYFQVLYVCCMWFKERVLLD